MISMKKLPVGYRLNPSEEDIINHHLQRKLLHVEEQYCLIPEFDIYKLPPWDLISKFNELSVLASDGDECFFFHLRSRSGKTVNRKTPQGFWKCTGQGRRPQDTDRTKWRKRILVYHIGKQKQAAKTDWAMHEFEITTNPSVVLCRVHKIKQKKGKQKVDSVSSGADSNGSTGETTFYEAQVQPQEASLEASINITREFQSPNPPSGVNVADQITSSTQQTQIVAEERLSLGEDAYADSIELLDLEDPQYPRILAREQSTCSDNRLINEGTHEDSSWPYFQGDTLEEAGHMWTSPHNNPMEEMCQLVGNKSFNGSVSGTVFSHLRTHGPAARELLSSVNCGPEETNFKSLQEAPEYPSDFQNLAPSSYPDSANTPYSGKRSESQQTNLEVTWDFGIDSLVATECMDFDFSDAFLVASSPPLEI